MQHVNETKFLKMSCHIWSAIYQKADHMFGKKAYACTSNMPGIFRQFKAK